MLQDCMCTAQVMVEQGTVSPKRQAPHTDTLLLVQWQHKASLLSMKLSSLSLLRDGCGAASDVHSKTSAAITDLQSAV